MSKLQEDFKLPAVKIFLLGLGLVGAVVVIILVLLFWQKNRFQETALEVPPHPSPRLQVEFEAGILAKKMKALQLKDLNSYRWRDPQHQFAKVPIQRAIEALSQETSAKGEK